MNLDDMLVEEVVLEHEVLARDEAGNEVLTRDVVFDRDIFAQLVLGDRTVAEIIGDDETWPDVPSKWQEILSRMDDQSRQFWARFRRQVVKG